MFRKLSFVVLLVLGVLSLCCSVAPPTRGPTGHARGNIDALRSATVALVQLKAVEDPGGGSWTIVPRTFCTGVWVSETRILTAGHCVADLKPGEMVDVASYSESDWGPGHEERIKETHSARLVKFGGVDVDLALLSAYTTSPHGWASVGASVDDGEPVMIVGHPIGFLWNVVPGFISAHRWQEGPTTGGAVERYLHITSAAFYGNSGGAAFNEAGELIGICSFLIRPPVPLMTFFVPPEKIRRFVTG